MGANIMRAESERRRTTQTTVTFERIDQKRRFEAIRDATRIETIEINESEEEEIVRAIKSAKVKVQP